MKCDQSDLNGGMLQFQKVPMDDCCNFAVRPTHAPILPLQLQRSAYLQAVAYIVASVFITFGCFVLAIWYSHRIYSTISIMHKFSKKVCVHGCHDCDLSAPVLSARRERFLNS